MTDSRGQESHHFSEEQMQNVLTGALFSPGFPPAPPPPHPTPLLSSEGLYYSEESESSGFSPPLESFTGIYILLVPEVLETQREK